jgi:hypothetical protein
MSTIRIAQRKRFTQVDREAINDARLSYKARGILVWLLDKPDDWTTTAKRIEEQGKEGREAVQKALKELEQFGYLERSQYRDDQHKWRTDWVVHEDPKIARPVYGFPQTANRQRKAVIPIKTETNTETRFGNLNPARIPGQAGCSECHGGWIWNDKGETVRHACKESA